MKLAGRIAVVTGAASGIGRAVALLFAQEGAGVAVVDQNGPGAEEVCAIIRRGGGVARPLAVDVAEEAEVLRACRDIADSLGTATLLVTSAAISVGKTVTTTAPAEWERVFAVNVRGVYLWLHHLLPPMAAAGGGSIVTIASQLALAGARGSASYAASKGAVISLTRSVALDYAEQGIRANTILPGAIDTPFLHLSFERSEHPAAAREASRSRHPLGRFGRAEEVARAALHLASDEAAFTTGIAMPVDGGWLAG
jgi:NAD(P)-dependent dehydrogenase (short-subunit alcohol dehydrogenase family)